MTPETTMYAAGGVVVLAIIAAIVVWRNSKKQ